MFELIDAWLSKFLVTMFLIATLCGLPGKATISFDATGKLSKDLSLPIYQWKNDRGAPKAVVLALHGFMLQGKSFGSLARELAAHDIIVVAPDIRGFGRWYHKSDKWKSGKNPNYKQAKQDIVKILSALGADYPNIPVVLMGESMGANLSVSIAAKSSELIDGLILSSPCIVRRGVVIQPRVFFDGLLALLLPLRPINLVPYARRYAADDIAVINEMLKDPLTRTKMNAVGVLGTLRTLKNSLKHASEVPKKMPSLVIQGAHDQLCTIKAIKSLAAQLPGSKKEFYVVEGGSHLLFETRVVDSGVVDTVEQFLNEISNSGATQNKQLSDSADSAIRTVKP